MHILLWWLFVRFMRKHLKLQQVFSTSSYHSAAIDSLPTERLAAMWRVPLKAMHDTRWLFKAVFRFLIICLPSVQRCYTLIIENLLEFTLSSWTMLVIFIDFLFFYKIGEMSIKALGKVFNFFEQFWLRTLTLAMMTIHFDGFVFANCLLFQLATLRLKLLSIWFHYLHLKLNSFSFKQILENRNCSNKIDCSEVMLHSTLTNLCASHFNCWQMSCT